MRITLLIRPNGCKETLVNFLVIRNALRLAKVENPARLIKTINKVF